MILEITNVYLPSSLTIQPHFRVSLIHMEEHKIRVYVM